MIISARSARRRLLILSATRWFPVGLTIGLITLIPLQRGIGLAELGVILSAQGFVVLALELPTGGLADALGRRPVLVLAGVLAVISGIVFLVAHSLWVFVLALGLQGFFRALDSGPLEAWYVDTALAGDPDHPVAQTLSQAATVLGVTIAVGALASGGLIAWHPLVGMSALLLPYTTSVVLMALHTVLTVILVREPHRAPARLGVVLTSAAAAPQVVAAGLRTLRTQRVLRCLVLVEVFWSVGIVAYLAHGAAGPMHATLLHRQATAENRSTVLSMNSMIAGGTYSLGLLVLGPLAQHTTTSTAIVVAGAFSAIGALLYLPARRQERDAAQSALVTA